MSSSPQLPDAASRQSFLAAEGKFTSQLYNFIRQTASVSRAKDGTLFAVGATHIRIPNLDRETAMDLIRKLVREKHLIPMVGLMHELENRRLYAVTHLVAEPVVPGETVFAIQRALADRSAEVIRTWSQFRSLPAPEEYIRDMENADPRSLASIFCQLSDIIAYSGLSVSIPTDMVFTQQKLLMESLVHTGAGIEIPGYGVTLALPRPDLRTRYYAAVTIMERHISGDKDLPEVVREKIREICDAEALYSMDHPLKQTSAFAAEKAGVLLPVTEPGKSLALVYLEQTAPFAEAQFLEGYRSACEEMVSTFRETILNKEATAQERLQWLSEDERSRFPREVWDRLSSDSQLCYISWQTPEATWHLFTARDREVIRGIISGYVPGQLRHYQVLALRQLISEYEPDFRAIFRDAEVTRRYGLMLREAYNSYIPWYVRILHSLGIHWLDNAVYNRAKADISAKQEKLSQTNAARNSEKRRQERESLIDSARKERKSADISRIIRALGEIYFEEHSIAFSGTLRQKLGDISDARFAELLKESQLQKLTVNGDSEIVLLFPVNNEWRGNFLRLQKSVSRLENSLRNRDRNAGEDRIYRAALMLLAKLRKWDTT